MTSENDKIIEKLQAMVDYTPCCDHGHECKSNPISGVFEDAHQVLRLVEEARKEGYEEGLSDALKKADVPVLNSMLRRERKQTAEEIFKKLKKELCICKTKVRWGKCLYHHYIIHKIEKKFLSPQEKSVGSATRDSAEQADTQSHVSEREESGRTSETSDIKGCGKGISSPDDYSSCGDINFANKIMLCDSCKNRGKK